MNSDQTLINNLLYFSAIVFLFLGLGCSKDSGVTIGISPTSIFFGGGALALEFGYSHSGGGKSSVSFFSDSDCKIAHPQIGSSSLQEVEGPGPVLVHHAGPWPSGSYAFFAKAIDAAGNSSSCTKLGTCEVTADLIRSCSLP